MGIAVNFIESLRKLMADRGLNPNSAAAAWHLPQRTLAALTQDVDPVNPRLSTVEAIANAAGVPVSAMLEPNIDTGEAALIARYRSLSPPERAAFLRGLGLSQPESPPRQSTPVQDPPPQPPKKRRAAAGEAPAKRRKSDRAAA